MIPILILAAGRSARMGGRDKLLEDVGGMPLLRRQALRAHATGQPVFVALPTNDPARLAALEGLDVTALPVSSSDEGLSGTLRGAVAQLPTAPAFMTFLADLVALETDDLQVVTNARESHPGFLIWRGATEDGKPGHPIIFDASLRPAFNALQGDSGGEAIVKAHKDQTCLAPLPGQRARLDLDTPEDWAAWRESSG